MFLAPEALTQPLLVDGQSLQLSRGGLPEPR
jgi:hypothetical protein